MDERGLSDQFDRLRRTAELDQAGDHVQAMRELVLLGAERVGEAADVVQLPQQGLELGAVAQGDDRADVTAAHVDRHAVDDEHAVVHEHDVVGTFDAPGEHVANVPDRDEVDEPLPHDVLLGADQPLRLIVHERDAAVRVGGDGALANTVQQRLALLDERRDLLRLEAERLPLHAPCEQNRPSRTKERGDRGGNQQDGQDRDDLVADVALEDADGDHADDPAARVAQRDLCPRGAPKAPFLRADELVPGEDRRDRLAGIVGERLADQ